MTTLVHAFLGVSMINGHDGLRAHAKKCGVNMDVLPDKTAVVFFSRNKMRIKVLCPNGVLSYLRAKQNRPFSLDALQEFPRAFSADESLDYDKALKMQLEKAFEKKGKSDPANFGLKNFKAPKLPRIVQAIAGHA